MKLWWKLTALILFVTQPLSAGTVGVIDFSKAPEGKAKNWLKDQGFLLEQDWEDGNPHFKDGALWIAPESDELGLFALQKGFKGAKKVRILWGVLKHDAKANWEGGKRKEAIGIYIFFGSKKLDSGGMIPPDLPYFLTVFPSDGKAKEGTFYKGSYYHEGGRYFCMPCNAPTNQEVTTEFELAPKFKAAFGKDMPEVSGVTIEFDTSGPTKAYIKKIEFLDE